MATSSSASAVAAAPEENLWSSILNSVAQSHASQRRRTLVVLGQPGAGKTTLVEGLVKSGKGSRASSLVKPIPMPQQLKKKLGRTDLAMGYTWFDPREEGDEETLAPLSIYVPSSSHSSHLQLLPRMLSPLDTSLSASTSAGTKEKAKRSPEAERNARAEVLRDTAVLVVLDWTKPGRMMEDLVDALNWLDAFGKEMGGERIADEQRAKLQAFIQHYTEPAGPATPSASNASPTKPSAALPALPPTPSRFAHASNEVLPLGSGTLTHNPYGIPLFLVCTKSDQIDLVAEELGFTAGGGAALGGQGKAGKGGWEERTDWVGCVLRTVGLMYGASIHHTSTAHPATLANLRSYVLHRLFSPPPPATTRFPFAARAEILERPTLLVPSGWDSWGKITAVKDGFDPGHIGEAWDLALSRHRKEIVGNDQREGEDNEEVDDLRDLWEEVVPFVDSGAESRPQPRVSTTDPDSAFLSRHYEILQKELARDPRSSFRTAGGSGAGPDGERTAGIVGPLGSGGLSLPGVQRALAEMEGTSTASGKESRNPSSLPSLTTPSLSAPAPATSSSASSPLTSPLPGGANGAGQPPPSTEALHNFFQSLLTNRKNTSLATLPTAAGAGGPPPAARE